MTNEESADLINDPVFRGRVKVAVLRYADSLLSNPPPSHAGSNAVQRWALQAFQQPDMAAQQVQGPTVMDANVQSSGKDVTDENLQRAVEAQVNKMI